MNDPKRWLDHAAELSEAERRALRAGLDSGGRSEGVLADEAKRAVWQALSAELPAVAGKAAAASTIAAGKTAIVGGLVKATALGIAVGVAIAGGVSLRQPAGPKTAASAVSGSSGVRMRPEPEPSLAPEAVSVPSGIPEPTKSPPPAGRLSPAAAARETTAPALPSPSPSLGMFPSSEAPAVPSLRSEMARIGAARGLLRAGQARAALEELDAVARVFPGGTLVQEREALAIEALTALGEREAARQRALRFLALYPTSPHAAGVRRALE